MKPTSPRVGVIQRKTGYETERRLYVPPQLRKHDKLPVITAGSISKEMWQFEDGTSDPS